MVETLKQEDWERYVFRKGQEEESRVPFCICINLYVLLFLKCKLKNEDVVVQRGYETCQKSLMCKFWKQDLTQAVQF